MTQYQNYVVDRHIDMSTPEHPGPWIGKQRVYQTDQDRVSGKDWFGIFEKVYDQYHNRVLEAEFAINSCLVGTRKQLMLAPDTFILYVKKLPTI